MCMKKTGIYLCQFLLCAGVVIMFFAAGCSKQPLSDSDKAVLMTAYQWPEQQQAIEAGKLTRSQKSLLAQAHAAEWWLSAKYPSHSFELCEISLPADLQQNIYFSFTADGGDTTYSVSAPSRNSTDFRESFCVDLFHDKLVVWAADAADQAGIDYVAIDAALLGMAGDRINESTPMTDLFSLDAHLSREIRVYLCGGSEAVDDTLSRLRKLALPGVYFAVASDEFVAGVSVKDCERIARDYPEMCVTDSVSVPFRR